jgi:hypothetical protein
MCTKLASSKPSLSSVEQRIKYECSICSPNCCERTVANTCQLLCLITKHGGFHDAVTITEYFLCSEKNVTTYVQIIGRHTDLSWIRWSPIKFQHIGQFIAPPIFQQIFCILANISPDFHSHGRYFDWFLMKFQWNLVWQSIFSSYGCVELCISSKFSLLFIQMQGIKVILMCNA